MPPPIRQDQLSPSGLKQIKKDIVRFSHAARDSDDMRMVGNMALCVDEIEEMYRILVAVKNAPDLAEAHKLVNNRVSHWRTMPEPEQE